MDEREKQLLRKYRWLNRSTHWINLPRHRKRNKAFNATIRKLQGKDYSETHIYNNIRDMTDKQLFIATYASYDDVAYMASDDSYDQLDSSPWWYK